MFIVIVAQKLKLNKLVLVESCFWFLRDKKTTWSALRALFRLSISGQICSGAIKILESFFPVCFPSIIQKMFIQVHCGIKSFNLWKCVFLNLSLITKCKISNCIASNNDFIPTMLQRLQYYQIYVPVFWNAIPCICKIEEGKLLGLVFFQINV